MSNPEFLETEIFLEGLKFPEGLRWHDEKLWFSDMFARKVMTVDLQRNAETIIKMEDSPSGLGWLPDGTLLIVSMNDERLVRLDPDGLKEVADLKSLATFRCNDMVVDKKGRAYVGNCGFNFQTEQIKPAEIILVTPEGNAQIVADNLAHPNGTIITPDDKTLIVAETFGNKLTAFDILEDGLLKERRIWANLKSMMPDGICLDAEGGIWIASPGSGKVFRILEGGKVTHEVKVSSQAYACMLGGIDRCSLFVATSTAFDQTDRIEGRIEIVRVEIPGAGLP
ncbi:MAG: SMP-30/gluconolactonase/LRE family protein [Candidatus Lokiarchaeota archaeon]|nr:SMP-30/gluconolactonase/LRE family protein [Candidatus Lokiarchaeota archaeon]